MKKLIKPQKVVYVGPAPGHCATVEYVGRDGAAHVLIKFGNDPFLGDRAGRVVSVHESYIKMPAVTSKD